VPPKPLFFATPADWRRWLARHHKSERELWVGFHKRATGRPSITWPESVDEALCVGWIDGLRKSLDADTYMIRFTPRRSGSNWSLVNVNRVKALIQEGRMKRAGAKAFDARKDDKTVYRFEQQRNQARFSRAMVQQFKTDAAAWAFFQAQPPGYRRIAAFYVISAKQEPTRQRRLEILIAVSKKQQRIGLLSPSKAAHLPR